MGRGCCLLLSYSRGRHKGAQRHSRKNGREDFDEPGSENEGGPADDRQEDDEGGHEQRKKDRKKKRYVKWSVPEVQRLRAILKARGGRVPSMDDLRDLYKREPFNGHNLNDIRCKMYKLKQKAE
ncbi:uncharacterized protein LOC122388685 isoform X1 [Amphibalanus amphitrite]|uniref:uncharacterized protein LOC122364511 isoform X1 n=1 Tax=Amphibalanus amphitrite TaxID=1232801 RepID=UPI001C8FCE5E|nr:uncharacterized protein LOC122364511 isoform X1 [Amphibalanus amphitrite]XP_043202538.1 uncharacterized protein LOC122370735 isoform X1 [Amphibalanus amphitrite]XP_043219833.1 uncharacterized protein LOC122380600 isoform X1 [Amphibalanus amphitrite]XP_043235920.1 uncharacterized protein LOC122388685 isoform X1 [Amphibalanus amphitrite]